MHTSPPAARRMGALLIALLAGPLAGLAAQQAPASDTTLLAHAARMARQKTTQLQASGPQPNAASAALYREALADIERGEYANAQTGLVAALQRARENPLYRADLGYVYARLGRADDAVTEYTRAYQALPRNAWLLVAVAAVRAAQQQYSDAAGTVQLAASNDSSIVDSISAGPIASWFARTTDRTAALAWARLAIARDSSNPASWFTVARVLAERRDTTNEGSAAIRKYFALLRGGPADPPAYALLGNALHNENKLDSAILVMKLAAQDSFYREYVAQYYLEAGQRATRVSADSGLRVLAEGRAYSTAAQRPVFAYLTGRAQLVKLQTLLANVEESHACPDARAADSLATAAEANLRDGAAVDSARAQMFLTGVLPGFKQNAQSAVASCREPGQAPARPQRPAPARRPAPAPAPARRP